MKLNLDWCYIVVELFLLISSSCVICHCCSRGEVMLPCALKQLLFCFKFGCSGFSALELFSGIVMHIHFHLAYLNFSFDISN